MEFITRSLLFNNNILLAINSFAELLAIKNSLNIPGKFM